MFLTFTLELFDTPEIPGVLEECKRVLKPGGRIVAASMSKEGGGVMLDAYQWLHRHLPNLVDCRPIYLSRALESAGFRVEKRCLTEMWVPVEIVLARTVEEYEQRDREGYEADRETRKTCPSGNRRPFGPRNSQGRTPYIFL